MSSIPSPSVCVCIIVDHCGGEVTTMEGIWSLLQNLTSGKSAIREMFSGDGRSYLPNAPLYTY